MGNYRFKLSDMIHNSWFYKLKDMVKSSRNDGSKLKKTEQQQGRALRSHQHSVPRMSCHSTRDNSPNSSISPSDLRLLDTRYFPVPSPPRRSAKHCRMNPRKSRKKPPPRLVTSSVSAGCSCRATLDSVWAKTEPISLSETEFSASPSSDSDDFSSSVDQPLQLPRSFDQMVSRSASRSCSVNLSSNDIVIDVSKSSLEPDAELPSKKPLKFTDMVKNVRRPDDAGRAPSINFMKEKTVKVKEHVAGFKPSSVRGFAVNSPGVKLRINSNSPRIGPRKRTKGNHRNSSVSASASSISGSGNPRTSLPDCFAIVKSSVDPSRDFRESMVEMIVENNIWASKDLEELLACYLALNSDEYHDVIISVFKQIWFDLSDIRLQ